MDTWVWIVLAIVALAVILAIAWGIGRQRRTATLREQFGPEYDRTLGEFDDRRAGESELESRRSRREGLDIRPLDPAMRQRYAEEWEGVQSRFVDDPGIAVTEADGLIVRVMRDRGYPIDDFDQRAADISVDHPRVVEHYREAHEIADRSKNGRATTEDMRKAVVHYRVLFAELLDQPEEMRRSG
jgi:hypothetical protein